MSNYCSKGHWENGMKLPCRQCEIESLQSQLAEVTRQRDELLAALEKIATKCNLDMHGDDGSLGGYAYGIWNTANAAIASVKEKA